MGRFTISKGEVIERKYVSRILNDAGGEMAKKLDDNHKIISRTISCNEIIDKLEETVWNLLNEEPVDSDEEEAEITLEKQNEIFQK